MKTWAAHLISFYRTLQPPKILPGNIEWLYPQQDALVMDVVGLFLNKFYNDAMPRRIFLGINPGRFGAGVTGINFTAPKQLKENCGIEHPFKNQSELSAEFIYQMIAAYGDPQKFYAQFFFGSACPLGFVQNGKNLNYYDDKELLKTVEPFMVESLENLLSFNADRSVCFIIGGEKNYKYLSVLNEKHQWFQKMVPLPHPRFIMQYKRKQVAEFIEQYLHAINPKK